jgi:hypothetical protein
MLLHSSILPYKNHQTKNLFSKTTTCKEAQIADSRNSKTATSQQSELLGFAEDRILCLKQAFCTTNFFLAHGYEMCNLQLHLLLPPRKKFCEGRKKAL